MLKLAVLSSLAITLLLGGMTLIDAQQPGGDPDFTTILTSITLVRDSTSQPITVTAQIFDKNGGSIAIETRTTNISGYWGEWHFDYLVTEAPFSIVLTHNSNLISGTCFAFSSDTFPNGLNNFAIFNGDLTSNVIANPGETTMCYYGFDEDTPVPSSIEDSIDEIIIELAIKDAEIQDLENEKSDLDDDITKINNLDAQVAALQIALQAILLELATI